MIKQLLVGCLTDIADIFPNDFGIVVVELENRQPVMVMLKKLVMIDH